MLVKSAHSAVADEEMDEIAEAAIEEIAKEASMEGFTKSDAAREMRQLAREVQRSNPNLTPQEAFIKASDSRDGKRLVSL